MSAELNGATERPDEGFAVSNAGEFAVVWNALAPEHREQWAQDAEYDGFGDLDGYGRADR